MSTLARRLFALILAWLLLSGAACTPTPESGTGAATESSLSAEPDLANTEWRLVSFVGPDGETPVSPGSMITIELGADGQAVGTGGCNTYSARYEVQGNTLSFSQITSTLRACAQEDVGEQEQRYLRALETTGRFELAGEHLKIWYEDGQGVLNWLNSTSSVP